MNRDDPPETVRWGLTQEEARERLAREGFNDLPSRERRTVLRIIAEVIREPMFALLIGAAVLYGLIGDVGEAILLLCFAGISVTIAVIQQGRSERVLDALRDLASPRALVIRDGQRVRIPGREVVRGDAIVVAEGDRVPADGVLVSGENIQVDESLLTGESVPVRKQATDQIPDRMGTPGGDDLPFVFSGTLIVRGTGIAVVLATGAASEIGAIGKSVAEIGTEVPRLQQQTRRMVIVFGIGGFILSAAAVLLYGFLRGDWLEALLGGIALGMSMLPEEFPLVLTVFMVMGAWRLARSRVLTRRPAAIETLGAATVLCTDKTGTLTRNLMSVAHLQSPSHEWHMGTPVERIGSSPDLSALLRTAVLSSDAERIDPMERSLWELADQIPEGRAPPGTLIYEYPLSPQLLAVTRVWRMQAGADLVVAAKGAPEAIARLCRLSEAETAALEERVSALARQGMRVLGAAEGTFAGGDLPESPTGFSMQFRGLIGFADPLRESVPDAVRECQSAGIRIVMITGDYPETARAIARQAGIEEGEVLTGDAFKQLDDEALAARVQSVTVFARIAPQQKLRIVNALKENGEVVAMTGDGVNDAPALKSAHIGIAMGGRGTDVAREASSIVLLDDDFSSIVRAVRLGRRIYDNLVKAMGYILAIHVPIAGLALLPIVLGLPLVLTPMLIALLELIIDPACSIVLEAEREERDVMNRPPRDPNSSLLSFSLVAWSVMQGMLAFVAVGTVFLFAAYSDMSAEDVRAIAFITLVAVIVSLIFVNRTFSPSLRSAFGRPNRMLWIGLGLAAAVLTVILAVEPVRQFFGLGALYADGITVALMTAFFLLVALELAKRLRWRRRSLATA